MSHKSSPLVAPAWNPNLSIRKRGNTGDLTIPPPLYPDEAYNVQCLNQRTDYAEQRLNSKTRYLTPNSEKILTLYKNACLDLLLEIQTDGLPEDKAKHLKQVRDFETEMQDRYFLKDVSDPSLINDLIQFRQYSYWARYGDYASHIVHTLREQAKCQPQTKFADQISGQYLWTTISKEIRGEEAAWAAKGSGEIDKVKTTYAVYDNCSRAGINFHTMITLIHHYAERNDAFHRGLREQLELQDYHLIARWIYNDLRDLSSVAPPNKSADETAMRAVLEQLRDQWFDTSYASDQPGAWVIKPAIRVVHEEIQKTKKLKEETIRRVAEAAAKRLDLDEENEDLLVQAATQPSNPFKLPQPGPEAAAVTKKGKSKKDKSKAVDISDRRQAWDLIMAQQGGQYSSVVATLARQREINRIVSEYRKVYGEEPPQD